VNRNVRAAAATILVIAAAALLLWGTEDIGRRDGLPDRRFDAAAWRDGDRRVRGAMTLDLERSAVLIGRTKGEVMGLIGPPTASDTDGHSLAYVVDLGLRTGPWGLGGTWLFLTNVQFDTLTGKATSVRTND
jgi:hypothetical protein